MACIEVLDDLSSDEGDDFPSLPTSEQVHEATFLLLGGTTQDFAANDLYDCDVTNITLRLEELLGKGLC